MGEESVLRGAGSSCQDQSMLGGCLPWFRFPQESGTGRPQEVLEMSEDPITGFCFVKQCDSTVVVGEQWEVARCAVLEIEETFFKCMEMCME